MDRLPFTGRVLLRGEPEVVRCLRAWITPGETVGKRIVYVDSPEQLAVGDLWLDLHPANPEAALVVCRSRGVQYLSPAVGNRLKSRQPDGVTAVLGAGACPGLIAAFARIAVRDFTLKHLRQRPEDPRRPELLKLLCVGQVARLVRLLDIPAVTVIAPAEPLREEAVRSLRLLLADGSGDLVIRGREDPGREGKLGILLHGDGRNDWWTGCHPEPNEGEEALSGVRPFARQTAACVLGCLVWMLRHPRRGVRQAEDLPHEEILEVALPHLGEGISRSL